MRRILFVDDEQQILDGLRDGLRKQRQTWDMVFCSSGAGALEAMNTGTFDVIVADMRMPGMDGAQLLAEVKRRSPGTVRIVLSGQADRELVMKMLPVSQQFLSKPCSIETLRGVIDRACTLRDVLQDPAIQNLVGDVVTLPAAPSTYLRLSDALASLRTGIADVAAIVEADPALSAKLLQIVNSAYFGYSNPVTSVAAAVNYLGLDLIKALSLLVGILSDAQSGTVVGFSVADVQQEALLVAHVARCIVVDAKRRDEAFTVGVLHDIGKLILAARAPQQCADVLRVVRDSGRSAFDVETEMLGTNHAILGAFLLATWGLPLGIVQGVAYHHAPAALHGADDSVTIAVHIADAMVSARIRTCTLEEAAFDREMIARLGFEGVLEEWWGVATAIVDQVAAAA